jgi:hypothetical protein
LQVTLPTDKIALRFWVLQGYNATHISALVTYETSVANSNMFQASAVCVGREILHGLKIIFQ